MKLTKKELFKNILFAAFLALLFVSTIFISRIISYTNVNAMVYISEAVAAILYGLALISDKSSSTIFKWLFSIPLSYIVFQYFWKTEYAVRSLNWIFPGYGDTTAADNFVGFFELCFLLFCCAITMCLAFVITKTLAVSDKEKNCKIFKIIQAIVCGVAAAAIIAVVIILEQQFPDKVYR